MNITRHLYLSTAVRAPDDPPAAPDLAAGDPPTPIVSVAGAETSVSGDPPAAAPEVEAPKPADPPSIPMRVFQQRVGEETTRRQAEERRRTEAEQKAANLQAIIDRMQTEGRVPVDPAVPPTAAPRTPVAPAASANLEEAVRREVDQREVTRNISGVIEKGVQEFTQAQWDEKSNVLAALGAATPEFVQDVIAVDPANAHRILFQLAEDPGKAADLAAMDVRRRTAELTRMSMVEQAKNPPAAKPETAASAAPKTPVSRAPAPVAIARTNADVGDVDWESPDGNAKITDAEFEKRYKAKYYKTA
jgi:hypothetical protein